MAEVSHSGGCMCGAVRYMVKGEPKRVGLCHCETCRRNTGAILPGFVVFARDQVEVTGLETGHYDSSSWLIRHFCRICGSSIFSESERDDEMMIYPAFPR